MVDEIRIGDTRELKKDVVRSSVEVPVFDEEHMKKASGHIGRNVGNITMQIKIIMLCLRNS